MTVQELINKLSKMPPSSLIVFEDGGTTDSGEYETIDVLALSEDETKLVIL